MDIKLTKQQFINLYMDTSKTIKQLSLQLGISENKIIRKAKELGISRRKPSNNLIILD